VIWVLPRDLGGVPSLQYPVDLVSPKFVLVFSICLVRSEGSFSDSIVCVSFVDVNIIRLAI
jgi:hypothetical protein